MWPFQPNVFNTQYAQNLQAFQQQLQQQMQQQSWAQWNNAFAFQSHLQSANPNVQPHLQIANQDPQPNFQSANSKPSLLQAEQPSFLLAEAERHPLLQPPLPASLPQSIRTESFYNRFYALCANRSRSSSPVVGESGCQKNKSTQSIQNSAETLRQRREDESSQRGLKRISNDKLSYDACDGVKKRHQQISETNVCVADRESDKRQSEPSQVATEQTLVNDSNDSTCDSTMSASDITRHISDSEHSSDEVADEHGADHGTDHELDHGCHNERSDKRNDRRGDMEAVRADDNNAQTSESREFSHRKRQRKKRNRRKFKGERVWSFTSFGQSYLGRERGDDLDFVVVSYNVLSQDLLRDNQHLYAHCSRTPQVLQWEYRWRNLLEEFRTMNADILCLQEVNVDHFQSHFLPGLRRLGYDGVFKKRTGNKLDGCATFFKVDVFQLMSSVPVEYFVSRSSLLDRDNVGLVLLLKILRSPSSSAALCVANTHLLFNPKRGDVKLAQMALLLGEVDRVACQGKGQHWPVILCGDLNLEPCSEIHRFLTDGQLEYQGQVVAKMSGQVDRGTDRRMSREMFPKDIGFTDNCQWLRELQQRKAFNSASSQQQSNSRSRSSKHSKSGHRSDQSTDSRQKQSTTEQSYMSDQASAACASNCHGNDTNNLSPWRQNSGVLTHSFNFMSAYKYAPLHDHSQEVSTFHGNANCIVDHIFHSTTGKRQSRNGYMMPREGTLRLMGRLSLFRMKEAEKVTGRIPNQTISSDHFPLVARFLYKLKKGPYKSTKTFSKK